MDEETNNPIEEMRDIVRRSQMSAEQNVEYIRCQAVLWRAAYESLLGQEFSEEQAMRIMISRGPMLL